MCNIYATNFTAAATGSNLTYKWQTRAPAGTWTTITALNANTIDAGVVYSNYAQNFKIIYSNKIILKYILMKQFNLIIKWTS